MLDAKKALVTTERNVTLDVSSFAQLHPDVSHVFTTENEINFLAFPPIDDTILGRVNRRCMTTCVITGCARI
ncbi:DUF2220 family protein [Paraburkholderia fungorum]|uniref:Wadjet anti-phage system protein JetD domain-containing protein n=1 Tax=Paraburkholderia fungorum TaxID=134537 RepID=UPI0038BB001E